MHFVPTSIGVFNPAESDSALSVTLTEADQKVSSLFIFQQELCFHFAHKTHDEPKRITQYNRDYSIQDLLQFQQLIIQTLLLDLTLLSINIFNHMFLQNFKNR